MREESVFYDGENVLLYCKVDNMYFCELVLKSDDEKCSYSIDNQTIGRKNPTIDDAIKILITRVYKESGKKVFGYNKFFDINDKGEINGWLYNAFLMNEIHFHLLPDYIYENDTFNNFSIAEKWKQYKETYVNASIKKSTSTLIK
jgi:hypothetical protein